MKERLSLTIRKSTIDLAKEYARAYNISLSQLVENYLEAIVLEKRVVIEITPLVQSLSGVVELINKPDLKRDYTASLTKKYQ